MSAFMIAGCVAVATLALALSLLVGDALRRERREDEARRMRRARVFRQPVLVAARVGVERRVAPATPATPERRRAA
jgi:hypothetical protein